MQTLYVGNSLRRLQKMARQLLRARRDVNAFAALCITDPEGRPLVQHALHRQVQRFLDGERRALIELPRDHGKSVQVCLRVLWELGRDPSLRVKIVCASDEL